LLTASHIFSLRRHTDAPGAGQAGGTRLYKVLIPLGPIPHRFLMCRLLLARPKQNRPEREEAMFDILMLALGAGLFILTIGYAYACDRL